MLVLEDRQSSGPFQLVLVDMVDVPWNNTGLVNTDGSYHVKI